MKLLGWSNDDDLCKQVRTQLKGHGDLFKVDRSDLPDKNPDTIARGMAAAVKEHGIDVVMVGSNKLGKEVGPRLAALLDWPFAGEVQSFDVEGGEVKVSRMVLSGNSLATYTMGKHAVLSATPGTFDQDDSTEGTELKLQAEASKIKVVGTKGEEASDFDLSGADYVVGVGRGFKAKDDLKLAEELAAKLKGGAVGCSRPVAADLKWLGEEHWIGLSGHEIKPKVYFACGVSGQIQHVAGIRGSKLIVAINTNKDAPIFQIADFGIVGDLYKILPQLTAAL